MRKARLRIFFWCWCPWNSVAMPSPGQWCCRLYMQPPGQWWSSVCWGKSAQHTYSPKSYRWTPKETQTHTHTCLFSFDKLQVFTWSSNNFLWLLYVQSSGFRRCTLYSEPECSHTRRPQRMSNKWCNSQNPKQGLQQMPSLSPSPLLFPGCCDICGGKHMQQHRVEVQWSSNLTMKLKTVDFEVLMVEVVTHWARCNH